MAETDINILIVDDEAPHRILIRRSIAAAFPDAKLLEAENLTMAKQFLENTEVSLISLDLCIGSESGFDLLSWVRDRSNIDSLPVMILSTSQLLQDVERGYLLGANCYLSKNPDPDINSYQIQHAVKFLLR